MFVATAIENQIRMLSSLKVDKYLLNVRRNTSWEEIPLTRTRTADTDTTDDESSPRHVATATRPGSRKWNRLRYSLLYLDNEKTSRLSTTAYLNVFLSRSDYIKNARVSIAFCSKGQNQSIMNRLIELK